MVVDLAVDGQHLGAIRAIMRLSAVFDVDDRQSFVRRIARSDERCRSIRPAVALSFREGQRRLAQFRRVGLQFKNTQNGTHRRLDSRSRGSEAMLAPAGLLA